MSSIQLRRARPGDQTTLGRYGADLMRRHHDADPQRFILTKYPEEGYGRFLVSEIDDPDCLVMVAQTEEVIGYVFASIEGTSWRDLRGPCGFIHDVYVDERARNQGAGGALLRAAIEWIHSRGMTQVVLWTKTGNEAAQHLFEKMGFRRTMLEMTLDGDATAR